jgi:hypothetical protein
MRCFLEAFSFIIIYWVTLNNVMDGSIIKILYADVVLEKRKDNRTGCSGMFQAIWHANRWGKILYGMIMFAVAMVCTLLY